MTVTIATPPSEQSISVEELKAHNVIEFSDDDTFITGLIQAADNHLGGLNGVLGRPLLQTTYSLTAEYLDGLCLPFSVAGETSVSAVTYFDKDNAAQVFTDFSVQYNAFGAYLYLANDVDRPALYVRPDAVQVSYTVGGAAVDVPSDLKLAVAMLVAHWYEHRSTVDMISATRVEDLPLMFRSLIEKFRATGV